MKEDRRDYNHESPDSCPKRRCSDKECASAREDWLKKEVIPAFEKKMYVIVAGAVGLCAASFVWLHDLSNTKLELKIKETYEDRAHHDEDVKRMERMVSDINSNVAHAMNKILDNQAVIKDSIGAIKR